MRVSSLRIIGSVVWRAPRFLGALLLAVHRLRSARRKAMGAFYRAMVESGVPEPLARQLREAYPRVQELGGHVFRRLVLLP